MPETIGQALAYLCPLADASLAEQLSGINACAQTKGLAVAAVLTDSEAGGKVLEGILSGLAGQRQIVLLVWDLFSLAASPARLDSVFAAFERSSSHLIIAKDQLDTRQGKELAFGVARLVLRYASGYRREAIRAGLEKARQSGKRPGRPPIKAKDRLEAAGLRDKGLSYRQIGRLLGLEESTIRKNLKPPL